MPGLALALSVWLRAASIALLSLVLLVVTSASASAVQVSPSKWNSAPDYISAKGHPHSAGLNWYAYCGGDPVNRMDPSGLDWVDYRSDGSVYLVPEMDDTWGTDTDTRYRIGTLSQSMPGFIDLDPSFVSAGGSRLVSRELLDQHADDNNTGSMGSGTQWAVVRGYVRRAAVGQYAHNVFWDTLGDDVNAALARGSNGAQRAVQGTATAIGSIALAVPSGGTTSLTLSVGVDQTWAGMQDIWNASDPNAVPVSTHLANLIGEKPATYVEVVSGLVTSPGLGPKPTPPNLRTTPGPFSLWSMSDDARGLAIEAKLLGRPANLSSLASKSFPVIDDFMNGVGTSIKSMDLTRSTYAKGRGFFNALNRYTHSLSVFQGGTSNGFTVRAADMTERVLRVAVEPGRITPFIQSQIDEFMIFARENYPNVKILIETIK